MQCRKQIIPHNRGILFPCLLAMAAALFGMALPALAEFADYRFIPPAKALADGPARAVAAAASAGFNGGTVPRYQIEDYAGQSDFLKETADSPALQVGAGARLDWHSADLFEAQAPAGALNVWRASITSVDASALRLQVDLQRLHPEDEVWVVDVTGGRAFGPFTLADAGTNGRWLPTTMGDTAVLELRSPRNSMPDITVTTLSHYFDSPTTKQLDCPISADCTEDTALHEVSTGIGRMSVTDENGTTFICSGALLNNAVTDDLEGLFLTADHCFQGTSAKIFADGVEVIWDMRMNGCPGVEPSAGDVAALPRSTGAAFLRTSTTLDGVLLQLASVPVGTLGRAYLGWNTRAPRIGDAAVGLHHPGGTAMKESIGGVNNVDVDTRFGQNQTTISWDEGITEGGSSGSPVMFDDTTFHVFGMLSNGNFQACNNANARLDQYSSFRDFFADAGGFLTQATPPDAGRTKYSDGGGGLFGCVKSEEETLQKASGNVLVSGLAVLTLLGMGAIGRRKV